MDSQKCLLCDSTESTLVQKGIRFDPESSARRCNGCGLVFLSPMPTERQLSDYYADTYRAEYQGVVSPEFSYKKGIGPARERARRMVPHLRPDGRVLEIGSSAGQFLEAVRPYAGSVIGVEPGVKHAKWTEQRHGVKVVGDLQELKGQTFEAIGLFHTLEHFRDPVAYLKNVKTYLAADGILFIEVPNVDDALISVYKVPSFPESYFQRAHLYYFSSETLHRTIAAAGGRAEITGIQRYDLSNHLRWLLTGQPGGQGYYDSMFPPSLLQAYAEALMRANCADTLWAMARFAS